MSYQRKTKDVYILEANYGFGDGFEYVTEEDCKKQIRLRLKEYQQNAPQYAYRVRKTRTKIF